MLEGLGRVTSSSMTRWHKLTHATTVVTPQSSHSFRSIDCTVGPYLGGIASVYVLGALAHVIHRVG